MENKTDKPYSLQISDLLDNILPADGVGTERERLRMTLHTEISKATEDLETQISLFRTDREERMQLVEELRKENEALTEQLALKATTREMQMYIADLKGQIERLKESNKQMKEIFNMIKPQLVKHGFKGTTEEIEKFIQKSEGDLLKVIIDKSKELDAEQKSHTVTNTDQLRINAMGKSER